MHPGVDADRGRWEERHATDDALPAPSPFVVRALDLLAAGPESSSPRRALDVACGRGRHALLLAERGYAVDAVDYASPALTTLRRIAAARGLDVRCLVADVTMWPLPAARYALITVVNFLERGLFAALRESVAPGGVLVYETHRRDTHGAPALRPEFLLAPGELEELCRGWHVLLRHDDYGMHRGARVARSGIVARRPIA
jgi:tellurite methyltransferase